VVVGLFLYAFIRPRAFLIVVMFVAGMILAFFRSSSELIGEYYIRQFFDKTVVVTGVIDGDPETDEKGTKIKLNDLVFGESGEVKLAGSLYISAYKNYKSARGDVVTLFGKLAAGFGTYAGYMYRPNIVKHQRPEPGDLVLKVRNLFSARIKKLIPEPEVNLGMSYLLGMKSGLPDDLSENLRIVGLVHIVVASGAHLSILVEIAKKIFGKISRMASLIFSLIFILFFMAMVGWTPSILRAGVMAILTLVTWFVGRKISPIRMIITVMAGTLLINPMFVINLGWLLSFASFGGIMILGPILTRYFYGEKKPGFIGETVITTLSATLMTLPITLYYYGTISLISVVANLLILPTLSYAMGLVFLVGVVSGMQFIETIVAFVAEKLLDFHILVVNFFGSMGYFLIKIPEGQPWVFLIYLMIAAPLLIGHFKQKMVEFRQVKY
jgi:competence protein ComEC